MSIFKKVLTTITSLLVLSLVLGIGVVLGQESNQSFLGRIKPAVFEVTQSVPLTLEIEVPTSDTETMTVSVPTTVDVNLQISITGGDGEVKVTVDDSAANITRTEPPTNTTSDAVNKGIVFGEPVVFDSGGFTTVSVLTTNTTDLVKSFTVKATYKTGDEIVATASGSVNHLAPGQMKAATLFSQDEIPTDFDTVRVDVDTMILEEESTEDADASAKIVFGKPVMRGGILSTVDVEATNEDSAEHSFTVQVIFLQDDKLVGFGSGSVNDLAPGQTKTASLITRGTTENAEIILNVDTMVK